MGEEPVRALNAASLKSVDQHEHKHHTAIQSAAEVESPVWKTSSLLSPKISLPLPSPQNMAVVTAKEAAAQDGKREWNTSKLGLRMGVDAVSAGAAGILVAPIITMIDKGIIENASGRNTLGESLKKSAVELLSKPHRFVGSKPFVLIFVCSVPTSISHSERQRN